MDFVLLATAQEASAGAEKFLNIGGLVWAMLGVAVAIVLAGIGSSKGVMYVGSAGIGLMSEEPKRFLSCLILTLLPSTQGIYGFVIGFMLLNKITGADQVFTIAQGLSMFIAALPVGVIGLVSGICQGKVAASGISLAAKQPKHWTKGMLITLSVEMFALFGFLVSIFMLGKI